MASNKQQQLQAALEQLKSYELPSKYQLTARIEDETEPDEQSTDSHQSLLKQYQNLRDEYLKRKVLTSFLNHIRTYDATTRSFQMPAVSVADQENWKYRRHRVITELDESAQLYQRNKVQMQQKYAVFCHKRQELERMIEEMQLSTGEVDENTYDDENWVDVDDEELARQDDRLITLKHRKAELEGEIQRVRQETSKVQQSVEACRVNLDRLQKQSPSLIDTSSQPIRGQQLVVMIEALERENKSIRSKLCRLEEMDSFYDSLLRIFENLSGIRVLSIESDKNYPDGVGEDSADFLLVVQVFGKHTIQIGLKSSPTSRDPNNMSVKSMKFLTVPTIQGASLKLEVPALTDLIRLVETTQLRTVNPLQFCLAEAVQRIVITEARVEDLSQLQEIVVTKIGRYGTNANNENHGEFGGHHQEVVCSFNEQITVVLRLTSVCPLTKGSVYVDQIVGLGGWQQSVVEQLKDRINGQQFASCVSLVQAIQDELGRLVSEEGLILPGTPTLPSRQAKDSDAFNE